MGWPLPPAWDVASWPPSFLPAAGQQLARPDQFPQFSAEPGGNTCFLHQPAAPWARHGGHQLQWALCECTCPLSNFPAPGLGTSSWVLARELVAWTPLSICWVQRWAGFPPLLGSPHPRASCYGHCPLSHATQSCHLLALPVIALFFLPLNKSLFSRQPPLQRWGQAGKKDSGEKGGGAETGGSQSSAHPTCVGSAGPKSWVLKVFVEEGG